ncbi:MAG: IPT/TIG domain-containing protein [Mangrovibacterium sp.]
MKKKKFCVLACFFAACFIACNDKDDDLNGSVHDPSMPVEIHTFLPDSGHIREKVVIKGTNFGNDVSQVEVFFQDDVATRKATVIGVEGEAIYCLAPRQNGGNNAIRIVIAGGDTITGDVRFRYTVSENISTIIGGDGLWVNPATVPITDGKLSDARTDYVGGIACLGNESGIVFDNGYSAVRYFSVPDNTVVLLQQGFIAAKPAVSSDRTKVYAVRFDGTHTIYRYSKDNGWAPGRVGELGSSVNDGANTLSLSYIGSLTFADNDNQLYFCDRYGVFGYFDISSQQVVIVNSDLEIPDYGGSMSSGYNEFEKVGFLVYDKTNDCFFFSAPWAYSIYKISRDGQQAELYAGSPSTSAISDGYRTDCSFRMPHGLTLDDDGNIYVTDGSRAGGFGIRKISTDGYVSLVAGDPTIVNIPSDRLAIDGPPLSSRFIYPCEIAYDGEGAFWIGEGWGRRLRKYAVE